MQEPSVGRLFFYCVCGERGSFLGGGARLGVERVAVMRGRCLLAVSVGAPADEGAAVCGYAHCA